MKINDEKYRVSGLSQEVGKNHIKLILLPDKLNKQAIVIEFDDKTKLKEFLKNTWKTAGFL